MSKCASSHCSLPVMYLCSLLCHSRACWDVTYHPAQLSSLQNIGSVPAKKFPCLFPSLIAFQANQSQGSALCIHSRKRKKSRVSLLFIWTLQIHNLKCVNFREGGRTHTQSWPKPSVCTVYVKSPRSRCSVWNYVLLKEQSKCHNSCRLSEELT